MKPLLILHETYQQFLLDQFGRYYGPTFVIINKDWPLVTKFWMTDLSAMTTLLCDQYSLRGPEPRDPASMFRSLLVLVMTNPTMGVTEWVNEMKRTPLHCILSGFEIGDVPGVGTFYDFFHRLWASHEKHLRAQKRKRRKSKPKKAKKGQKASTATPGRIARLVGWMMRFGTKKTDLPSDRLFQFFQENILSVSAHLGLLGDCSALSAAGDGTPIETAARVRSKPPCDCRAQGLAECHHPRIYSQPDCDSGWDSSREKIL